MTLALMVNTAERNGATKVAAVVPYFAYAKQGKTFLQGETISIEVVASTLRATDVTGQAISELTRFAA